MSDTQDSAQAIHARILELLESGPVPQAELTAAVAIQPDERERVHGWEETVQQVAKDMQAKGEIALDTNANPPVYTLHQ